MKQKAVLTLEVAHAVLQAAQAEAAHHHWSVAIAVVDDGGHPLALQRADDCAPISAYLAIEKARTAALGRRESKDYESMINSGRVAFLSAPVLAATLEGGVPVIVDGDCIGAIGVAGVKAEENAQVAMAGVAALGNSPGDATMGDANR